MKLRAILVIGLLTLLIAPYILSLEANAAMIRDTVIEVEIQPVSN